MISLKEINGINDTTLLYQSEQSKDNHSGIFGYEPYQATLSFSDEKILDYQIILQAWDDQSSTVITKDELNEEFVVPLPDLPAHCTILATFETNQGKTVQAEFWLNISEN